MSLDVSLDMNLGIQTFSNQTGPNVLYKALSHPLAAARGRDWLSSLAGTRVVVFDPHGWADQVVAFYPLEALDIADVLVQRSESVGGSVLGRTARPVTDLPDLKAEVLIVLSFDSERFQGQLEHWLPAGMEVQSLAELRLPDDWVSDPRRYLNPVNFVTNQVFFRDADERHTRLITINYWSNYGAPRPVLRALLFAEDGVELARFDEVLGGRDAPVVIDSREVRSRFGLGPFTGQLFVHVTGAAGHDVFKYALDVDGKDGRRLSCTHDANAWPADRYGGLPAPGTREQVRLWLQNPHAVTIPPGGVSLLDPDQQPVWSLPEALDPFATRAVVVDPGPARQLSVACGRYLVRPRYEIDTPGGHSRIAHLNVERSDLEPDRAYGSHDLGKGYLLPAPVLDPSRYDTSLLVTPMSSAQDRLGLQVRVYDSHGNAQGDADLGCLSRSDHDWFNVSELADGLAGDGHLELCHHPETPGDVDGWFHAIFRYHDRRTGHSAETSFGCHLFNGLMTYRNEPQSYAGPPPGLSTRLFLRLGNEGRQTHCHLIYPSSTDWRSQSQTRLVLHDASGQPVAEEAVNIPLNGSFHFKAEALFGTSMDAVAGTGWILIRDPTCRLFGYHGLMTEGGFSLDHLFGF